MARIVNFYDGAESETTPTIGNIVASSLVQYPDDATFEATEQGAPFAGNIYFNTTDNVIRYYNGTTWQEVIDENTVQAVENKSIDADTNMITNIDNNEIKALAGIEATKIADGSVTDAEFQYINSLTSNAQDQINSKQSLSEKGQPDGYAELDGSGKVPAGQLPSYVDDVLEYANFAALPVTGETGKIYVTLDDNLTYRWTGTVYVEVGPSSQANNQVLIEGGNWDFVLGMTSDNVEFSQLLNDFTSIWSLDNTTTRVAYNFVPSSTFDATGITIHWNDVSIPTGEFVIELMPIIGGFPGEPDETSVLATTGIILGSSIGVGPQTYYFTTPVTLTSGAQYAYAHRTTTIGSGGLDYNAYSSAPGTSYRYTTNNAGATWSNVSGFTGTFEIISSSTTDSVLTLDDDSYVQQEGFLKNRNTIQAQSINFLPSEDIAYVTVNKSIDSLTNLTVNTGTLSSFSPGPDDLIIARLIESGVEIGRKLFLKDGENSLLQDGISIAGGANLTLSNLSSPTAINRDLIPDSDGRVLGNSSFGWKLYLKATSVANDIVSFIKNSVGGTVFNIIVESTSMPSITTVAVHLKTMLVGDSFGISTRESSSATKTGDILLESGNNSSTGDTGNIIARPGTINTGTRGKFKITDGSEGTIGHVFTSTDVNGGGSWESPQFVSAIQNIPTALNWNVSPPGGTVIKQYKWIQVGKKVDVFFWFDYTGAPVANQFVFFTIPGDLPAIGTQTANSLETQFVGAGSLGNGGSLGAPCATQFLAGRIYLNAFASVSSNEGHGHICYYID